MLNDIYIYNNFDNFRMSHIFKHLMTSSLDNEDIYYYNDYNIDDYEDNLLSHEIILILLI